MSLDSDLRTFTESPIKGPSSCSVEFLRQVIESLPEALVVIDGNRNIVMANRVARLHSACIKCYQCFHLQDKPCTGVECPVELVSETKGPVRVYHTHYGEANREIAVAIDAAPMFDEQGDVKYTIETCRDVTERALARRLSRIGNRHMSMPPLLAEYANALRGFTQCVHARIDLFDENCAICGAASERTGASAKGIGEDRGDGATGTVCLRALSQLGVDTPPASEYGSICFDDFTEFLSTLPEPVRNRLGPCVVRDCASVVLVPVRYADEQIGTLLVANTQPGTIAADLVKALERLSWELGAAIHRVRVEENLQEVRDNLEMRVRERTEELTESNEALQKEIEECGRLERELLEASVREQQRIGQELHDGLGQELTGISYLAQNLVMSLKRSGSPEVESARELASGIQTVVGQIQQIVRGLVPLEIGSADLKPALEVLAGNVEKQTGVTCRFETNGENAIMEDNVAIQMYRIAQEALTNAVKHAQADEICVTLWGNEEEVGLAIADNGVGVRSGAEQGPGCGLRSMRHRAWAIGGRFSIRRGRHGGTHVECSVARPRSVDSDVRKHGNDLQADHS